MVLTELLLMSCTATLVVNMISGLNLASYYDFNYAPGMELGGI